VAPLQLRQHEHPPDHQQQHQQQEEEGVCPLPGEPLSPPYSHHPLPEGLDQCWDPSHQGLAAQVSADHQGPAAQASDLGLSSSSSTQQQQVLGLEQQQQQMEVAGASSEASTAQHPHPHAQQQQQQQEQWGHQGDWGQESAAAGGGGSHLVRDHSMSSESQPHAMGPLVTHPSQVRHGGGKGGLGGVGRGVSCHLAVAVCGRDLL
jgi:hypothetical protein